MSYFPIYSHQSPGGPPTVPAHSQTHPILTIPSFPPPSQQPPNVPQPPSSPQGHSPTFHVHYAPSPPQLLGPQPQFAVVPGPQPYPYFAPAPTPEGYPFNADPRAFSNPAPQQTYLLQVSAGILPAGGVEQIPPGATVVWPPAQPQPTMNPIVGPPAADTTLGLPQGLTADDFCHDSCAGNCQRGSQCRFHHPPEGFWPVPKQTCRDFERGQCQRRYCKHFHGSQDVLDRLAGYALYNPATGQGYYPAARKRAQ